MGASVWCLFYTWWMDIQLDGTYKLLMYSHIQLTRRKQIFFHIYLLYTANPVWFINSPKSFSIESIPICNYMFLNRIMTFCSNGFCWAGSSNALQKHIFPNRIIKVQLENYNSFPKYKLFPGLKNLLKEKEFNFKILNLYWKKNYQHMVITVYIKGRKMHNWSQFSQPNIGKSNFEYSI
jgi:hypothetical protein